MVRHLLGMTHIESAADFLCQVCAEHWSGKYRYVFGALTYLRTVGGCSISHLSNSKQSLLEVHTFKPPPGSFGNHKSNVPHRLWFHKSLHTPKWRCPAPSPRSMPKRLLSSLSRWSRLNRHNTHICDVYYISRRRKSTPFLRLGDLPRQFLAPQKVQIMGICQLNMRLNRTMLIIAIGQEGLSNIRDLTDRMLGR